MRSGEVSWSTSPQCDSISVVDALADRLVDYRIQGVARSLQAGADACFFADDWGAQRSLLINPERWRQFFKPRYKRVFEVVKNYGGHVWFHTDGYTWDILDDLIEIGIDVLNPQHHIMGDERVAERIAGKVCLRSDLDRQHVLPHGTREEVEEHVKQIIALFGAFNDGLILHGEIGPDVPFDNVKTMYDTCIEYGRYPLIGWDARARSVNRKRVPQGDKNRDRRRRPYLQSRGPANLLSRLG